jgi:hypothetical protein
MLFSTSTQYVPAGSARRMKDALGTEPELAQRISLVVGAQGD